MNISKELKIWKVSIFWENLSIDLSEPPISTTLLVYAELLIHEGLSIYIMQLDCSFVIRVPAILLKPNLQQ